MVGSLVGWYGSHESWCIVSATDLETCEIIWSKLYVYTSSYKKATLELLSFSQRNKLQIFGNSRVHMGINTVILVEWLRGIFVKEQNFYANWMTPTTYPNYLATSGLALTRVIVPPNLPQPWNGPTLTIPNMDMQWVWCFFFDEVQRIRYWTNVIKSTLWVGHDLCLWNNCNIDQVLCRHCTHTNIAWALDTSMAVTEHLQ